MIFSFENNACTYKLRTFSQGTLLCNDEECILCRDGTWEWPESFLGVEIHAVPGKDFSGL